MCLSSGRKYISFALDSVAVTVCHYRQEPYHPGLLAYLIIRTGKVTSDAANIIVCTDSKSLIESLKSTKQVDEAPMRLNVARLKDMKEKGDIMEFKWVPTEDMLADALTKQRVDPTILKKVLRTGYLKHP
jgi:hypothetical protein